MSDVRAGDIGRGDVRRGDDGYPQDDRLPWLEAVEVEERGPSPVKLIALVLLGLAAIGLLFGGLYWIGNRASGGGGASEEVIASPGEYKVRPSDPGGMQLGNQGSSQVATSEGAETNASIDRGAAPEAPVTRPGQPTQGGQGGPSPQGQAQGQEQGRPSQGDRPQGNQPREGQSQGGQRSGQQQPAAQAQNQPRPQSQQAQSQQAQSQQAQPQQQAEARPSGPTLQVGAFPSEATANAEWTRLTGRYPALAGLQRSITVFQRGDQTFYRLRATGARAGDVCRRLRSARQPCMDVN